MNYNPSKKDPVNFQQGLMRYLVLSKEKHQTQNNFEKMNITKKNWFCYQCSLHFESKYVYSLHLKIVHKHIVGPKSIKTGIKSNKILSSDEKSDSDKQSVSDENEKKTFQCEICQCCFSRRSILDFHITSLHEGHKPFKCEFCSYTCSQKISLKKHVASVHEGKK